MTIYNNVTKMMVKDFRLLSVSIQCISCNIKMDKT